MYSLADNLELSCWLLLVLAMGVINLFRPLPIAADLTRLHVAPQQLRSLP
jgi:hypothetical protein